MLNSPLIGKTSDGDGSHELALEKEMQANNIQNLLSYLAQLLRRGNAFGRA